MMNISRKKRQFFLCFVDVLLLVASIPLTLIIRGTQDVNLENFITHLVYFLPTIIFWITLMYTLEFYVLENPFDIFKSTMTLLGIALITMLFSISTFYVVFSKTMTPKRVMVIYISISFALIFIWRYLYNVFYFKLKTPPNVIFLGYNQTVCNLIPRLLKSSYFGYTPLMIYDRTLQQSDIPSEWKTKVLNTPDEFSEFVKHQKIDVVVLGQERKLDNTVRKILFSFLNKNIMFFSLPDFYEFTTRIVPLNTLNDYWILSEINLNSKKLYLIVKRFLDILLATIFLVVLSPAFLILPIAIKLSSKGPVFFKQVREGKNNKLFSILKFRTMTVNDNDFSPTSKNDNRITSVGKFLRKSRLDEIPQMFNILKGDMSLIGPRPERPELAKILEEEIPFYKQRLLVKPGITGWDQISGEYHSPSVEDTIKKMQFDLYYIKNLSFLLDTSIFFKTIMTVFKRSGR